MFLENVQRDPNGFLLTSWTDDWRTPVRRILEDTDAHSLIHSQAFFRLLSCLVLNLQQSTLEVLDEILYSAGFWEIIIGILKDFLWITQ